MTRSVFISFFVIFVTIHETVLIKCGYNEVETKCPANCPTDYCPTSEDQVQSCTQPQECNPPKCKCQFNTRRAANGTCINTSDCPPFKCSHPNEEFIACPPLCPTDDCSQATLNGECPFPGYLLLVLECTPKCRCIKGYWRKDGVCVPYDQCPQQYIKKYKKTRTMKIETGNF